MCLKTINKTKPKSYGYGWKIFARRKGSLYSLYPHITNNRKYQISKWIKAKCTLRIHLVPCGITPTMGDLWDYPNYVPQFHILLSKPDNIVNDSKIIVIRRVRYRHAQIQGKDQTYPKGKCVVAGEIYIYKKKGDI